MFFWLGLAYSLFQICPGTQVLFASIQPYTDYTIGLHVLSFIILNHIAFLSFYLQLLDFQISKHQTK